MIVFKDKSFQTRSDKPNENWTDSEDVFVVDDNSELAQRIISACPYCEFVVEDGELVDIIELERPPEPPQPPAPEERIQMLEDMILIMMMEG